jgi:hypothetical protein
MSPEKLPETPPTTPSSSEHGPPRALVALVVLLGVLVLASCDSTVQVRPHEPAARAHDGRSDAPRVGRGHLLFNGAFKERMPLRARWSVQQAAADRVTVAEAPKAPTKGAARFEVRYGDYVAGGNRAEVYSRGWREGYPDPAGSERYYAWSTYLPRSFRFDRNWQVLMQHHDTGSGSPPLALQIQRDFMQFMVLARSGDGITRLIRKRVRRGRWQHFVLHVKWSPDPTVGFVELWWNSRHVLSKQFRPTLRTGSDGVALPTYWKIGLYRSRAVQGTGVVYHADPRIGRNYSSVVHAFGPDWWNSKGRN